MFEPKRVTVEILNDGSYDGMKHLTFPICIENCIYYGIEVCMVYVPLDALIAAGYDKEKGQCADIPDIYENGTHLPFTYGECRIID